MTDIKSEKGSGHYDANYGNFETELYAEIRRELLARISGRAVG